MPPRFNIDIVAPNAGVPGTCTVTIPTNVTPATLPNQRISPFIRTIESMLNAIDPSVRWGVSDIQGSRVFSFVSLP